MNYPQNNVISFKVVTVSCILVVKATCFKAKLFLRAKKPRKTIPLVCSNIIYFLNNNNTTKKINN